MSALTLTFGDLTLECLVHRALWWPRERTLLVADVHLGKAESFRALGVPVPAGPQGPTATTLHRLDTVLASRPAQRLVILGDLLHARAAQSEAVMAPLAAWRVRHSGLHLTLLRGNHDAHAGDPPASLGIELLDLPASLGPLNLRHEPRHDWAETRGFSAGGSDSVRAMPASDLGLSLCGHLHPVIRLSGRAGARARLPCFCVGQDEIVLPAFGAFTGGAPVRRLPGSRYVAIAGERLLMMG